MTEAINHARRGFLRGKVTAAPPPQRPPWALAEGEFPTICTRCGECRTACPTHIVQLRHGYPQIDFAAGACTFCGECARVCTPTALRRTHDDGTPRQPWTMRAHIGNTCLAARGVECRICGEHCEADAIHFTPRLGGPALPAIDSNMCTGCGACIAACPSHTIHCG